MAQDNSYTIKVSDDELERLIWNYIGDLSESESMAYGDEVEKSIKIEIWKAIKAGYPREDTYSLSFSKAGMERLKNIEVSGHYHCEESLVRKVYNALYGWERQAEEAYTALIEQAEKTTEALRLLAENAQKIFQNQAEEADNKLGELASELPTGEELKV